MPSICAESLVEAVWLHCSMKLARMAPAMPTIPVSCAVARGASVGAVVTVAPTIVKNTSTIVSCKTADQRSRGSTAFGSIDFEGAMIGDVEDTVWSISFSIGRLARKHYLVGSVTSRVPLEGPEHSCSLMRRKSK